MIDPPIFASPLGKTLRLSNWRKTVFNPAWTSDWMSDDARAKLVAYGIAAPGRAVDDGGLVMQWIGRRQEAHYKLIMRTFLRAFRLGHVGQLDAVAARLLTALTARTPLLPRAADARHLRPVEAIVAVEAVETRMAVVEIGEGSRLIEDRDTVDGRFQGGQPVAQQVFGLLLRGDVGEQADRSAVRRSSTRSTLPSTSVSSHGPSAARSRFTVPPPVTSGNRAPGVTAPARPG